MKNFIAYLAIPLFVISACENSAVGQFYDGDIIFHTSRSAQSIAIQKATNSKYSHMGIIFFRNGVPYVYEAFKKVQYTPLEKWISRGEGGALRGKAITRSWSNSRPCGNRKTSTRGNQISWQAIRSNF